MAAKTRIAITLLMSVIFLLSACSSSQPKAQPSAPILPPPPVSSTNDAYQGTPPTGPAPGPVLVEITDQGFSPQLLTISSGITVAFVNKNAENSRWPASDVHPTHTSYPGSSIRKCDTAEQAAIFDSCKGLATGEIFRFTFTEKGSWNYHDHLDAEVGGTIVVE